MGSSGLGSHDEALRMRSVTAAGSGVLAVGSDSQELAVWVAVSED